ncbi:hypothetical protein Ciccas_003898 [Cichlidogyrus casuarinus]|uniref:BAH domain-containing protein n=1 Tax=Cichlidogyrus casuarinus TaxID=1844966 RepID=A0ABD2QD28_9PLAT
MLKSISEGSIPLTVQTSSHKPHSTKQERADLRTIRSSAETVSMALPTQVEPASPLPSAPETASPIPPAPEPAPLPPPPTTAVKKNGPKSVPITLKKSPRKRGPKPRVEVQAKKPVLEENKKVIETKKKIPEDKAPHEVMEQPKPKPARVRRELRGLVTWDAMIEAEKQGLKPSDDQDLLKQTLDIQMAGNASSQSSDSPAVYQQRSRRAGTIVCSASLRHRQTSSTSASSSLDHALLNGVNAPSTPSSIKTVPKPPSPVIPETRPAGGRRRKLEITVPEIESKSRPRGRPPKYPKLASKSTDSEQGTKKESPISHDEEIESPNSAVVLPPRKRYKASTDSNEPQQISQSPEKVTPDVEKVDKSRANRQVANTAQSPSKRGRKTPSKAATKISATDKLTVETQVGTSESSIEVISIPEPSKKKETSNEVILIPEPVKKKGSRGRPKKNVSSDEKTDLVAKPLPSREFKLPGQSELFWKQNKSRYEMIRGCSTRLAEGTNIGRLVNDLLTETELDGLMPITLPMMVPLPQPDFFRFALQCAVMPGLPLSFEDLLAHELHSEDNDCDPSGFWKISSDPSELKIALSQLDKCIECMLLIWEFYSGRNSWIGRRAIAIKRTYVELRTKYFHQWKSEGIFCDEDLKHIQCLPSGMLSGYGASLNNKPNLFGLSVPRKKNERKLFERGCEVIRCMCGFRVEAGHVMVQCDTCATWQHLPCLWWALTVAMRPELHSLPVPQKPSAKKKLLPEQVDMCNAVIDAALRVSTASEDFDIPYYCASCVGLQDLTKNFPKNLAEAMAENAPQNVFKSTAKELEFWSLGLEASDCEIFTAETDDQTIQLMTDDYVLIHKDWCQTYLSSGSSTCEIDSSDSALRHRREAKLASDHVIIRIYRMWKNLTGESWFEGGVFLRPYQVNQLAVDTAQRWNEQEVIYDEQSRLVMPLNAVKGRCTVLNPQTYRIGRPVDVPIPDSQFRDSLCPLIFLCDKIITRGEAGLNVDDISPVYLRVSQKPYCFLKHDESSPLKLPVLRNKSSVDLEIRDQQLKLSFAFESRADGPPILQKLFETCPVSQDSSTKPCSVAQSTSGLTSPISIVEEQICSKNTQVRASIE